MFNAKAYIADSLFSDMHKDAFGFRPREFQYQKWEKMNRTELEAEHDRLHAELELAIEAEREAALAQSREFEKRIAETITIGAGNRATAIRWIVQSLDMGGQDSDMGYACFLLNIPYSYETEFVQAMT